MFEERRASPRRIVNCPGNIVCDGSSQPLDCVIADISDGGVRLIVASPVPEEFVLRVNDGTNAAHKCRVVWQLDDELGAEFV